MTLDEYQKAAQSTMVCPMKDREEYCIHGLVSEAGEVADVRKKYLARGRKEPDSHDGLTYREKMLSEIGDVLWYAATLAWEFGYSLENIAEFNLNKLKKRKAKGQLIDRKGRG